MFCVTLNVTVILLWVCVCLVILNHCFFIPLVYLILIKCPNKCHQPSNIVKGAYKFSLDVTGSHLLSGPVTLQCHRRDKTYSLSLKSPAANTFWLEQNLYYFADNIFKSIFCIDFVYPTMMFKGSIRFILSICVSVHLTICLFVWPWSISSAYSSG